MVPGVAFPSRTEPRHNPTKRTIAERAREDGEPPSRPVTRQVALREKDSVALVPHNGDITCRGAGRIRDIRRRSAPYCWSRRLVSRPDHRGRVIDVLPREAVDRVSDVVPRGDRAAPLDGEGDG